MFDSINMNLILTNTLAGFNRVYQTLNTDGTNGLTKDELSKLTSLTGYDLPFAQMLTTNFNALDKNKDGILSTEECQKLLSSFQTNGYTYEQLSYLVEQSGAVANKSLLETVLSNFTKVDKNHDGRITESEMNAYLANSEIDKKQDEYTDIAMRDMTIFYGGSDTDTISDSSSSTNTTSTLTDDSVL